MHNKIGISIAPGEQNYERFNQLKEAVSSQAEHFELLGCSDLPFDIRFQLLDKTFDVELKDISEKDNSDYLSSVLSGHLYLQMLEGRESCYPIALAVLGDDGDLQECIKNAARGKSHTFDFKKFTQYSSLLDAFEANCIGAGIQVWHLGYNQFPRLLLRARKILEGGNLEGFCPKPAEKERMEVGLSILAGRGVGPKMAANILKRYQLCLILRDGYCGDLEDCEGIGPKRAETITTKYRGDGRMTTKMEKKMIGQFYALTEENGKLKARITELESQIIHQTAISACRIEERERLRAQVAALQEIAVEERARYLEDFIHEFDPAENRSLEAHRRLSEEHPEVFG